MIKFKQGHLTNLEGVKKDIIVKAVAPNKLKDIIIGGGLVLIGIGYLTTKAFKYGSERFEAAEFKVMEDLGIIED